MPAPPLPPPPLSRRLWPPCIPGLRAQLSFPTLDLQSFAPPSPPHPQSQPLLLPLFHLPWRPTTVSRRPPPCSPPQAPLVREPTPPPPLPAASGFGPFGNAVALCLLRSHGGASAKIRQQEEDVSQQLGEAHRMVSEGRADVRMFTRSIASFCLLLRQMTRNLLSSCVHTVRIEDAHRDCSCRTQCRPAVLHPLIYP